MNINSKSFNFSVSNKSSSQTNEEKIKNKLKPQNIIDIKAKLKNGGEILLEEPKRKRHINISEKFLVSKHLPKIKFTNFINKNEIPTTTKKTIEKITQDISYICMNNEQVDFSRTNTSTLRTVLKEYGYNEVLSAENVSLFKVDGVAHYEKSIKENPFRIYLRIEALSSEETEYQLIFCDVYHLCITAGHNGLSAEQVRDRTYSKYCYICKEHIKVLLE
ncbi:hypothetical protein ACTXLQ_00645 [Enterococcus hirae]|uniref:hypothetical protein n=1 Tax=Enterococcus hirae TaxID=1354 RepID=UPI003FD3BBAB